MGWALDFGGSQRNRGETGGRRSSCTCDRLDSITGAFVGVDKLGFGPLQRGTLCGIEKLFVHIRVVNQKVTLGNWAGHETLVVRQGIGPSRGAGGHSVHAIGWIQ